MSVSSVVTRGYGTWSTVNKLPTWGYSIGAAVVVEVVSTKRTICIGTSLARSVMVGTSTVQTQMIGTDP